MKKQFFAILAASMFLAPGTALTAEPLKVALSTALSGPMAPFGEMHRAGVHLAVESINAQGGVLGRQLEIIEMDDACNPVRTEEVAREIVANADIHFTLGPLCSGTVPGAAKIYSDGNVVMIAPTASSDHLSAAGHSMFFRTVGKDSGQATAAAEYILAKLNPQKLAIIHENQAYGEGLAAVVKSIADAGNVKPVIFEAFEKGGQDFSALISKMKENSVDVVYYGGFSPELILMLQEAQKQGFKSKWVGPGGVASPAVKGDWVEGLFVTLPPDYSLVPANASIVENFKAKNVDPSGSFVMTSYASAEVLAEAIKRAGSDEPLKVAQALKSGEYKTVIGDTAFSPQGDNIKAEWGVFVWNSDATKTPAP